MHKSVLARDRTHFDGHRETRPKWPSRLVMVTYFGYRFFLFVRSTAGSPGEGRCHTRRLVRWEQRRWIFGLLGDTIAVMKIAMLGCENSLASAYIFGHSGRTDAETHIESFASGTSIHAMCIPWRTEFKRDAKAKCIFMVGELFIGAALCVEDHIEFMLSLSRRFCSGAMEFFEDIVVWFGPIWFFFLLIMSQLFWV